MHTALIAAVVVLVVVGVACVWFYTPSKRSFSVSQPACVRTQFTLTRNSDGERWGPLNVSSFTVHHDGDGCVTAFECALPYNSLELFHQGFSSQAGNMFGVPMTIDLEAQFLADAEVPTHRYQLIDAYLVRVVQRIDRSMGLEFQIGTERAA